VPGDGGGTTDPVAGGSADREAQRLLTLDRLDVVYTPREQVFDDLVALVAEHCSTSFAALSFIERELQRFKVSVGFSLVEIDRELGVFDRVVRSGQLISLPDASEDVHLAGNAQVTGPPFIRSYIGGPVRAFGEVVGALCVMSDQPDAFTAKDVASVQRFTDFVEALLELRWRRSQDEAPSAHEVRMMVPMVTNRSQFDDRIGRHRRPAWVYSTETLGFLAVNEAFIDQYGWDREQILSMDILDIRDSDEAAVLETTLRNVEVYPETMVRLWRHRRSDGTSIHVQITTTECVFEGIPARLVFATNVSARLASDHGLMTAARRDQLTGLANRQQFNEALAGVLDDFPERQLTVMLIDLDRFKLVNDRCGHDTGDLILVAAASRIASTARQTDVVARLGGDEFAILCPLSGEDAQVVAHRLCEQLRQPFAVGDTQHYLSASIGITGRSADSTAASMLVEADVAMYASKQAGRDQSTVFDDELKMRMDEWATIAHEMHLALDADQFRLDFQPIIDSQSERVYFEALLRWHHPTRGVLAPNAFLAVAEECGLIIAIGRDVMRDAVQAARQLADFQHFGGVCVNVSVRQFNDALLMQMNEVLAEAHIDPGLLIVEITESALAQPELAQLVVEGLRSMGVGVWIDDFGTGYSSLSRLSRLPVTGLKIDQSFVADLGETQSRCVTQTIIDLGRGLDLAVVGEGIESEQQARTLQQMGCRYLQGYHLMRPMPLADVIAYMDAPSSREASVV